MGWLIRERRRELPRTAGWLSRERRRELPRTAGWESRERRRKLPRTASMRARGVRTRLPRGTKTRETKKTLEKTNKTNEVKGRRLLFGLVFCHGAHSRERRGTPQTRRYFKIIVFNDNIKGRQGKVDTHGNNK